MKLDDVKTYITRKNLNSKSSKRDIVDERVYLYAYLYHFLKLDNLTKIGDLFAPVNEVGEFMYDEKGKIMGALNHATIRHHLIKAPDIQFDPEFLENTKELHDQIPIIIPQYKGKLTSRGKIPNVKKNGKVYEITVKVTKEVFFEYAKKQDPEVIMEFMFKHMLEAAPKLKKSRNPYKKSQ